MGRPPGSKNKEKPVESVDVQALLNLIADQVVGQLRGERKPRLLNTEEAERYLGLGAGYLKDWRSKGSGIHGRCAPPPCIYISEHKIIYDIFDLDKWADNLPRRKQV